MKIPAENAGIFQGENMAERIYILE